jgi:excisionase family DNA binding protein
MKNQDDILTISDVASLLKVAEKTVYGLAQKGDIPGFKVGGQWRFSRSAIDSWIEAKTKAASAQSNARSKGENQTC